MSLNTRFSAIIPANKLVKNPYTTMPSIKTSGFQGANYIRKFNIPMKSFKKPGKSYSSRPPPSSSAIGTRAARGRQDLPGKPRYEA